MSDWTEEEKDKRGDWPIDFSYTNQGYKIKEFTLWGTKQKDNTQQNAIKEIVADPEEKIIHRKKGWTLEEISQKGCEISTFGIFHNSTRQDTG